MSVNTAFDTGDGRQGLTADPLEGIDEKDMIASLTYRYPEQVKAATAVAPPAQAKAPEVPAAEVKPEVKRDPADEVDERNALRQELLDGVLAELPDMHPDDRKRIQGELSRQNSAALKAFQGNDSLSTYAHGLHAIRGKQPQAQTPQRGGGSGGGADTLTREEKDEIANLAPRLKVSVEELTAQYLVRRGQSA